MSDFRIRADIVAAENDRRAAALDADYQALGEKLARGGVDIGAIIGCEAWCRHHGAEVQGLVKQEVEIPAVDDRGHGPILSASGGQGGIIGRQRFGSRIFDQSYQF